MLSWFVDCLPSTTNVNDDNDSECVSCYIFRYLRLYLKPVKVITKDTYDAGATSSARKVVSLKGESDLLVAMLAS